MTTTSVPQAPERFGLPKKAIQAIQQVLAAHPEVEQAIVYGSRAAALDDRSVAPGRSEPSAAAGAH
ncbi:MAG: hypothetical protein ACK5FE_02935 [Cyanobacteriota bacterium]